MFSRKIFLCAGILLESTGTKQCKSKAKGRLCNGAVTVLTLRESRSSGCVC